MPHEFETDRDLNDPAYHGPYNENSRDAFDHPLNGQGRCELLNRNPPECPPEDEE